MAEKIKLVQGDTGPQMQLTVVDDNTEAVIALVGAVVVMHFKAAGSSQVLATLPGFVLDPQGGVVLIDWGPTTLSVPVGMYEGEVEVTFSNGMRQSVYRSLSFYIREQFA